MDVLIRTWTAPVTGLASNVQIPLCCALQLPLDVISSLELVFPAEPVVRKSRGVDREQPQPTRTFLTPTGPWKATSPAELRLLHSEVDYLLDQFADVNASRFVCIGSNYGSNPFYCIRHPSASRKPLFYLEQENLAEPHPALTVDHVDGRVRIVPLEVVFRQGSNGDTVVHDSLGQPLSNSTLVMTAPAVIWNRAFVGWERYTSQIYDVRNVVAIQYPDPKHAALISETQQLWTDRRAWTAHILNDLVPEFGYSIYQRVLLGIVDRQSDPYCVVASVTGTVEDTAAQLVARYPDLTCALQLTEGGASAIVSNILGYSEDRMTFAPSYYRRGRGLCLILLRLSSADTPPARRRFPPGVG